MRLPQFIATITLLLAAGTAARAHHSVAAPQYETSAMTAITGSLARIEWMNPHVAIHLDVKDNRGTAVTRRIELAAPASLQRRGFNRDDLRVGDAITLQVWLPSAAHPGMAPNGRILTFPDGRSFDVADRWPTK